MSAPLRVAIVGAEGRLGSFARELLQGQAGFEVVAAYGSAGAWPSLVASSGAQIGFEATRAGLGLEHGLALLEAGVRPLIATSGVGPEQNEQLDARARALGLGGLVVPNFSLGSWFLREIAAQAARHFPSLEIVELHHDRKRDAPSGTALETARRIARARREAGRDEPAQEAGAPAERGGMHAGVRIHSVRQPGLYAHQEILVGAPGETLSLRHDMSGPEAFGLGILAALRYVASARGVARGLEVALA